MASVQQQQQPTALPTFLDVYSPTGDTLFVIPSEDITHLPPDYSSNYVKGHNQHNNRKLTLCPGYMSYHFAMQELKEQQQQHQQQTEQNSESNNNDDYTAAATPPNCENGDSCTFVHASLKNVTINNDIHINFCYKELDHVKYERFPACVSETNDATKILRVAPPNETHPFQEIPAEYCLKTKAFTGGKRITSHCAHYYYNRICNRGSGCFFIHAISFEVPRAQQEEQERLHQHKKMLSQQQQGNNNNKNNNNSKSVAANNNNRNGNNHSNNNNNNNNAEDANIYYNAEEGYARRSWGRTQAFRDYNKNEKKRTSGGKKKRRGKKNKSSRSGDDENDSAYTSGTGSSCTSRSSSSTTSSRGTNKNNNNKNNNNATDTTTHAFGGRDNSGMKNPFFSALSGGNTATSTTEIPSPKSKAANNENSNDDNNNTSQSSSRSQSVGSEQRKISSLASAFANPKHTPTNSNQSTPSHKPSMPPAPVPLPTNGQQEMMIDPISGAPVVVGLPSPSLPSPNSVSQHQQQNYSQSSNHSSRNSSVPRSGTPTGTASSAPQRGQYQQGGAVISQTYQQNYQQQQQQNNSNNNNQKNLFGRAISSSSNPSSPNTVAAAVPSVIVGQPGLPSPNYCNNNSQSDSYNSTPNSSSLQKLGGQPISQIPALGGMMPPEMPSVRVGTPNSFLGQTPPFHQQYHGSIFPTQNQQQQSFHQNNNNHNKSGSNSHRASPGPGAGGGGGSGRSSNSQTPTRTHNPYSWTQKSSSQ